MGELQGVVHEVREDLSEAGRIAHHRLRCGRVHEDAQLHPFGLGLHRQDRLHVLDHGQQIEVQVLERQLPRLDLGEVEDVVDEREQGVPAGPHGLRVLLLFHPERRIQQQARHPDDAVHGRADLVAHVGQEFALEARQLQGPVPGLRQLLGGLFQLELGPAALGDVVVLPEVAQVLLTHRDGDEVHGQDAAVHQLELLTLDGLPGLHHGLGPDEDGLRVHQQGQALLQQIPGIALHQGVGGHRHLEHGAEGLVEQGDLPPLGLHQDAGLHVLDEGPQPAGGHPEDDLGMLPLGDVVQGARYPLHHARFIEGDALVRLHPLHVTRLGRDPELALEDGLPGVHRVGEHVEVAGIVRRVEEVQEGAPQALRHGMASELDPGRIQEGPLALPVDPVDHVLEVLHQGPVMLRLGPGGGQLGLQGGGRGDGAGRGDGLGGHAPASSALDGPEPRIGEPSAPIHGPRQADWTFGGVREKEFLFFSLLTSFWDTSPWRTPWPLPSKTTDSKP